MKPELEIIVGYDAREFWQTYDSSWSEKDRKRYLYRLDVKKPLSVDVMIWPSVFSAADRRGPAKRLGFQSFWADFTLLRSAVTQAYSERPLGDYRMIAAILVLGEYAKSDAVPWSERIPPVHPDRRGPEWTFLGYDVADQWALSGLLDCGFVPGLDDVPKLRQRWGPLLNKFHLFDDFDAAVAFKQMSDERLKNDHAPFFVFSLWLVK